MLCRPFIYLSLFFILSLYCSRYFECDQSSYVPHNHKIIITSNHATEIGHHNRATSSLHFNGRIEKLYCQNAIYALCVPRHTQLLIKSMESV